jgi:hypothetical protein
MVYQWIHLKEYQLLILPLACTGVMFCVFDEKLPWRRDPRLLTCKSAPTDENRRGQSAPHFHLPPTVLWLENVHFGRSDRMSGFILDIGALPNRRSRAGHKAEEFMGLHLLIRLIIHHLHTLESGIHVYFPLTLTQNYGSRLDLSVPYQNNLKNQPRPEFQLR